MRNQYLKDVDKEVNRRLMNAMDVGKQLTFDAVCVALNREFGFGEERLKKVAKESCEIYEELVDCLNGKEDMDGTFGKLDRELERFLPTAFEPYDVRYGGVLKMFSYETVRQRKLGKYANVSKRTR